MAIVTSFSDQWSALTGKVTEQDHLDDSALKTCTLPRRSGPGARGAHRNVVRSHCCQGFVKLTRARLPELYFNGISYATITVTKHQPTTTKPKTRLSTFPTSGPPSHNASTLCTSPDLAVV